MEFTLVEVKNKPLQAYKTFLFDKIVNLFFKGNVIFPSYSVRLYFDRSLNLKKNISDSDEKFFKMRIQILKESFFLSSSRAHIVSTCHTDFCHLLHLPNLNLNLYISPHSINIQS